MAAKEYRYAHTLGKDEAMKRAIPLVDNLAKKYMMKREDKPDGYHLVGKGVDAKVTFTDTEAVLVVELNFLLEKIARGQIDSELAYKVPKVLG